MKKEENMNDFRKLHECEKSEGKQNLDEKQTKNQKKYKICKNIN